MTDNTRERDLFGGTFRLCGQGEAWEAYELLPQIGQGRMEIFHLLPGVQVVFQQFRAKSCFSAQAAVLPEQLEVNYCGTGRYECELPGRTFVYMGPQDVVVNPLSNRMRASSFPLEEYSGTALLLDLREMQKENAFFIALGVNPAVLRQRCALPGQCRVFRADAALCGLFASMTKQMDRGLLRLRVLEVLARLCQSGDPVGAPPSYYPRRLIEAVKAARAELLAAPERLPLQTLAAHHGLARRALIDGFRGVYGQTPYAYLRQYRMHRAAAQLADPAASVSQIAADAGYQNASKFSKAFRAVFGTSPSAYRKTACTPGAAQAPAE